MATINVEDMYSIEDAYESEIGDLLMVSYRLREENMTLKHSLKMLDDELERHVTVSQSKARALTSEVAHLRQAVEELKFLAGQQEKELKLHHLRRKGADQARLDADLPIHSQSPLEPLYSVTLEEYNSVKIHAQRAQESLDMQESKVHRLSECLYEFDKELSRNTMQLVEPELATNQTGTNQLEKCQVLENRLLKLLAVCKALESENAANKALINTGELEAFRVRRSTVNAIREREPIMLRVSERTLSVEDAALTPVDPMVIASEVLFVATAEELLEARQCAVDLSDQLKLEKAKNDALFQQTEEYRLRHIDLLNRLEEALQLLEEARCNAEKAHQKEMDAADALSHGATEYENIKAVLSAKISHLESTLEQQREEIQTFRLKRFEALKARQMDGKLKYEYSFNELNTDISVPVEVSILNSEPLFCITLKELNELRDANMYMTERLEKMNSSLQDAFGSATHRQGVDKEAILQFENLLQEIVDTRRNYGEAQLLLVEKETELRQIHTLFDAGGERGKKESLDAKAEIEELQQYSDDTSREASDITHIPGGTGAVNDETKLSHKEVVKMLAVSHEAEHDSATQLDSKDSKLAYSGQTLSLCSQKNDMLDKMQRHINQMVAEKIMKDAELGKTYHNLELLREELKVATTIANEWERRAKSLELDLDAVSQRTEDLFNELRNKTNQYDQVIRDLHDFAEKQNRTDEKELIQRLAAYESELFELQEVHMVETEKYKTQVSILQNQINCLQDQLKHESVINDELRNDVSRLQKDLVDAREDVLKKLEEIGILKEEMEFMIKEHEEDIRELEEELDKKTKEASDGLERLEELSGMLHSAQEGERSALQLRVESDAEVFRLQREIDKLNNAQLPTTTNSVSSKSDHVVQAGVKKKRPLTRK